MTERLRIAWNLWRNWGWLWLDAWRLAGTIVSNRTLLLAYYQAEER